MQLLIGNINFYIRIKHLAQSAGALNTPTAPLQRCIIPPTQKRVS